MLNLEELFRRLSFGELSNLSVGSEGAGSIEANKHARIAHYADKALLRLYSRFVLLEKNLILQTYEDITTYRFLLKHASTDVIDLTATKYILDTEEAPFTEDLIKIMAVHDSDQNEFPLNDSEHEYSLFTPQPNTLQVPRPVDGEYLIISYQASHPLLDSTDLSSVIDLPVVLHEALTAHVAHQVFSNMNGQENAVKAGEHLAKYESVCFEVTERDLVNSSTSTTNSKFADRGFV